MDRAGILLVALSALGFATLGIFGKIAFGLGWSSSELLSWRMLLAAVWVWGWLLWRGGWRFQISEALAPFLLGAVGYATQTTLYFAALERLPVGVLVLLLYVYPVFVVLLAWLLERERPTQTALLAMGLALVGIALTTDLSGQVGLLGVLLALASAAVYATYLLLSARVSRVSDPVRTSGYVFVGAALSFTALAWLDGRFQVPGSLPDWGLLLGISTVATVFPVVLIFVGLRRIRATQASIVSMLEPLFTIALGVLILGERLSLAQLLGGGLVLLSVVILQRR
ncbi:DMT family transporter [Meiothermus sp. CFH 77666]|uniref:EamA family transporter n=1 Tax=Meiothermus sp. CFH 77666 TaxID=2817942 RepID=UPI001AA01422|nr:DMT family transporter [Meiothermus sp. CFH 77666]